jgi:hypothetical protein
LAVAANKIILAGVMALCGAALISAQADAAWWSRAPADYEDCAAAVQKSATSAEDKDKRLTACEAKFAGRRKPGGGYTYYDFMQNRHFDIAGPNPTPEEQKRIDEQYAAYLNDQRRSIIVAAFRQKQQQIEHAKADAGDVKLTLAPKRAEKPRVTVLPRPRPKMIARRCTDEFFSPCHWPRISSGVRDLKKTLFGSFTRKDARS